MQSRSRRWCSIAYGDDLGRHVQSFKPYAEAGFDEIYVAQMGGSESATPYRGFFDFYADQVLPRLRELA